jgi:hypothetical protein
VNRTVQIRSILLDGKPVSCNSTVLTIELEENRKSWEVWIDELALPVFSNTARSVIIEMTSDDGTKFAGEAIIASPNTLSGTGPLNITNK